jgi:hypothetical protein
MIFIGELSAEARLQVAEKINFASVLPSCVIVYPWVRYQERSHLSTGCCNFVMSRDAAQSLAHLEAFTSRRRDPATKREAVLKTAAQLFLEKSYGKTSMNDVAERLNITKPALYHYFHNKPD